MRVPIAGLALTMLKGVTLVALNFDAVRHDSPETTATYYRVQQLAPPPASLLIPSAVAIAYADTLYSLFAHRDWRELLFLLLGSSVMYEFGFIVKPAMARLATSDGGAPLGEDEQAALLDDIYSAHVKMLPAQVGMLLVHLWTHVLSPK